MLPLSLSLRTKGSHLSFLSRPLRTLQPATLPKKSPRLHPGNVYCRTRLHTRSIHLTTRTFAARPPRSRDRGPPSSEDTQTDFSALNVLGSAAPPTTGIDACTNDGFVLNNDVRIAGSGVLLVSGEAFRWRPWIGASRREGTIAEGGKGDNDLVKRLKDSRGMWEAHIKAWGILDLVWPKPDLLILGTGPSTRAPSPITRRYLHDLGIRLEVQDTRNAAAQFNLLATERGLTQVAAALVPVGWRE
ncbi:hypothetical protein EV356DRAFT_454146 [Viridothelium virens]|uniref:NADH dehydrogenase [ubiquinone] 1 alpha subcomplex assembly factor 3 n=1 Tax=Viridothelium virens TaxID=1048519 RepID=A0A6A6GXH8_VIRVR|nr:hypothetical protein EV356DRAFT_454146 [Viridothelium virens]